MYLQHLLLPKYAAQMQLVSQNESVHTHLVSVGWLVDVGVDLCFLSHMMDLGLKGLSQKLMNSGRKSSKFTTCHWE